MATLPKQMINKIYEVGFRDAQSIVLYNLSLAMRDICVNGEDVKERLLELDKDISNMEMPSEGY